MSINVPLLLQVKEYILSHPEQFRLDAFFGKTACGTFACIGGTAEILDAMNRGEELYVPYQDFLLEEDGDYNDACPSFYGQYGDFDPGQVALGLTEDQADSLFYPVGWPSQFYDGTETWAEITPETTAARIDHFIATNGEE